MKQVIRYKCEYYEKEFKSSNKHRCRKDPKRKNCYSCVNWNYQFVVTTIDGNSSCLPEDACNVKADSAEEAFGIMHENGWYLDCKDWEEKCQDK